MSSNWTAIAIVITIPASRAAIANAVIAASRDNASQLGVQVVNLRLGE
jgi:hypothetical protein